MSEKKTSASEGESQESAPTASADTSEGEEATDSSLLELTAVLEKGEGVEKVKKASEKVPPNVPQSGISLLAHKIWIGNLDKRLSQENVLKFVTRYGTIVSFRFFFRAGTDVMEPRGYCFVEYSTREEAEKAKSALDGKRALGKKIVVDWARLDPATKKNENSASETWDPTVVSETLDKGVSTSAKIAALEAKLKAMEEGVSRSAPLFSDKQRRHWSGERRGRRPPNSRFINRSQRRGRTHHYRARGPFS